MQVQISFFQVMTYNIQGKEVGKRWIVPTHISDIFPGEVLMTLHMSSGNKRIITREDFAAMERCFGFKFHEAETFR